MIVNYATELSTHNCIGSMLIIELIIVATLTTLTT